MKINQPTAQPPSYYANPQHNYGQQQQITQMDSNLKNPYNIPSVNSTLPPAYTPTPLPSTPVQNYGNYGNNVNYSNYTQQQQKPVSGTQLNLQFSTPSTQQSPATGINTTPTAGQYGQYYNQQPQSTPSSTASDNFTNTSSYYGQQQYPPAAQQISQQSTQQPFQNYPSSQQNQTVPSYAPANTNMQANQTNGTSQLKNIAPQNTQQPSQPSQQTFYNQNTTGYQFGATGAATTQSYSQQPVYNYAATTTTQQNYTVNPYETYSQAGASNQPSVNPVSSPAQLQQLQQQQQQYNNLQYAQTVKNL